MQRREVEAQTYLTAILPFGGRDLASEETQQAVKARLDANKKLSNELRAGFEDLGDVGAALPLRGDALRDYFEYAVRGLLWHHWRRYLPRNTPFCRCCADQEGR